MFSEKQINEMIENMLRTQIIARGIENQELLEAMRKIPRHYFVKENYLQQAYKDRALPIDCNQTISQPYIVALMTNEISDCQRHKVLEIGTGCGYQTAILAKLFKNIFSVERIGYLAKIAKKNLTKFKINNIHFHHKDGYDGLKEEAPFAAILVACAAAIEPQKLLLQLAIGGKMVIPLGNNYQDLIVISRLAENKWQRKSLGAVAFVPMQKNIE